MKKYFYIPLLLAFFTTGCSKSVSTVKTTPIPTRPTDYKNISYTIEGKTITLVDGQAVETQSGSASKITTKIFEGNTQGDLNGDGLADTAVILTQDTGGSGIFYYIAAAIKTVNGYTGTNAILLGDRIAPQNNQINNNVLVVNYADRTTSENFSVQPSIGKSLYIEYLNDALVAQPEALQVSSPSPYQAIISPLIISGQARGTWFFEGSFPVVLQDQKGEIIAQGVAKTKADWMTENFVPFTATLTFSKQIDQSSAFLILKKDNPSGLPDNNDSFIIPVILQ